MNSLTPQTVPMAIPINLKQIVSFEGLLMSQVVQLEALTRLLVQNGILTNEEFLERAGTVDREMKKIGKTEMNKRRD